MGLLAWLFPSDDDRMDKAESLLAEGNYNDARLEVEGLAQPRAGQLRHLAMEGLKSRNCDEAIACANAGDYERAAEHLALAVEFSGGQADAEIRGARRTVRELRTEGARPKRTVGVTNNPFGAPASDVIEGAGGPPPDVQDDLYSLPPDDPRLRFALLLERYPDDLRARMIALGPEFATAVLATEDGTPAHAVEVLGRFAGKDPIVRFERARAAQLAGQSATTEEDLLAFYSAEGRHRTIAGQHTAVMLASAYASAGRLNEALAALETALAEEPKEAALLINKALVLERLGQLPKADELARHIVQHHPRSMLMYKLMARCRIKADKRNEATQVLEAGLKTNCTSGRCGSLPFDVESGRMLAQIYLEDRFQLKRADELLLRLKRNIQKPGWFDAYLLALKARNGDDPRMHEMVRALSGRLQRGDPRAGLLRKAFPGLIN
ncbi:MAG: tetratricopeptide repeat protein [Proteobacteria bacterium]|nr:tetratricopeptide repeat protein [Pseudomonadota bacterium]MCP4920456.1 tetratricopeptide repeat protein [Pseudomonadota bacterium]